MADSPAEAVQCEHVGVWVGKVDRHTQSRAMITHPQHVCSWAALERKKAAQNPEHTVMCMVLLVRESL